MLESAHCNDTAMKVEQMGHRSAKNKPTSGTALRELQHSHKHVFLIPQYDNASRSSQALEFDSGKVMFAWAICTSTTPVMKKPRATRPLHVALVSMMANSFGALMPRQPNVIVEASATEAHSVAATTQTSEQWNLWTGRSHCTDFVSPPVSVLKLTVKCRPLHTSLDELCRFGQTSQHRVAANTKASRILNLETSGTHAQTHGRRIKVLGR